MIESRRFPLNCLQETKGFSMIEVLIALIVLSVSLLALAGLMGVVTKNNSYGNHLTEATTFAQDKLEELRVSRWGSIAEGFDNVPGCSNINYTRTWEVTNGAGIKTVAITIGWNDRVDHSIRLVSVLSQ
jgi:prepilin-type N-terminal cleavage/methylation domain-containing protein